MKVWSFIRTFTVVDYGLIIVFVLILIRIL